jgi:hypothetical protein
MPPDYHTTLSGGASFGSVLLALSRATEASLAPSPRDAREVMSAALK